MSAMLKCRVCGKEYEGCRSQRATPGVYHWQEVACSPECGAKYLAMINESRGIKQDEEKEPAAPKKRKAKKAIKQEE